MVRSMKSPTFWVAFAALVVSLSSTAVAASIISGKNIRKGSIPGDRLAKNTVKGDRVKNKSLSGGDLRSNTLTGKQIAESKLINVGSAIVAGSAGTAGTLNGQPPAAFVRYAGTIQAGTTATGAFGCSGGAGDWCIVSFPQPSGVPLAAGSVRPGGTGGCTGSATAPTAPTGVVCLYRIGGGTPNGGSIGSAYGFRVDAGSYGVYAYKAPTPPVPD
jgi:hypothetical protein